MKTIFRKSISILMAFVVLFTTMSFAVDAHYCGNTLVDFSLLQKAESCGMEKEVTPDQCEKNSVSQKSCCSDTRFVVEGSKDLQPSFDTFSLGQQLFISTFALSYHNLFEDLKVHIVPFRDYSPPFLIRDLHLWEQTFLI